VITLSLCECGCDTLVRLGNKFVNGHNRKGLHHSDETKRKIGSSNKGHKHSMKTRTLISVRTKQAMTEEVIERMKSKYVFTPKRLQNIK